MAAQHDLDLVQGQRFVRGFRWTRDGVAQALAGYEFRAQVRAKEATTSAMLLDLTPLITRNADGVTLDLVIPGTTLAALDPKKFKDETSWDLFLWPTGDQAAAFALVEGLVTLEPSATDMAP